MSNGYKRLLHNKAKFYKVDINKYNLVRKIIKKTIQASGAESMQDMGRVMGILMKELADSADGRLVQKIVQKELS